MKNCSVYKYDNLVFSSYGEDDTVRVFSLYDDNEGYHNGRYYYSKYCYVNETFAVQSFDTSHPADEYWRLVPFTD